MNAEHHYTMAVVAACAVCRISHEELFNGRSEICVDARMLLIGWMSGYGYSESKLSILTGWSQQRINYIKNQVSPRLIRRVFRDNYNEMTRKMEELLG